MFWSMLTKILVNVLMDLVVSFLVKLAMTAGSALYENYRRSQQVSFA
jgi:hypothetical protein